MPRDSYPITGNTFILHLCKQLDLDPFVVSRVVIDAQCNAVAKVYIEQNGDERLLGVDLTIPGIEIKGVEND